MRAPAYAEMKFTEPANHEFIFAVGYRAARLDACDVIHAMLKNQHPNTPAAVALNKALAEILSEA